MEFTRYNSAEQAEISALMEQKQTGDFIRLYNNLVQHCFSHCANDFTTRSITRKEELCAHTCADKFLRHSERLTARFAEHQSTMSSPGSQA
ncbi:chaperone [Spinellus fusiger]|nr:chaperone [Spinellus fusiger]